MPANFRAPSYLSVSIVVFALASVAGCYLGFYSQGADKGPAKAAVAESPAELRRRQAAEAKMLSDAAYESVLQRNYDEAVAASTHAISLDPTLSDAHKNLALALCDQGRCTEALEPARQAVRLRQDFDKAHYTLGKVLMGLGRYAEAEAELSEALRLNPEYDKAFYCLGKVLDRLNEPSAAAEAMRQAARLKPEQREYRDKLELLSRHVTPPGRPSPAPPPPSADFARDIDAGQHFENQVRDYLYHDGFESLDRFADRARADRERLPGGYWKLSAIYGGLGRPESGNRAPAAEWEFHLGKLKSWAERHPSSVTARVGLAQAYANYAWDARGDGSANSVKPEARRLFRERLELAQSLLESARSARPSCPHWYDVMMRVALGLNWDAESHERLFQEATAFEPAYRDFYVRKAFYLLPQWHGRPGEWGRFAAEAADRQGGREGSALYFALVASVSDVSGDQVRKGTFFSAQGLSWERFRRGLADAESVYGTTVLNDNRACLIAATMKEKELARELFERIGEGCHSGVWRGQKEFEFYRDWASSE